jgi:hypothetical protein
VNNNKKYWTFNKIISIGLIIFLLFVSVLVVPLLIKWNNENNNLQKARNSHIVFGYSFNNEMIYPQGGQPDLQIDVSLTYPHGSIIVDDPIYISGIAIQNESIPQTITHVSIGFQNVLAYPIKQNQNGITNETNLYLWKKVGNKISGNTTITWDLEGTYYPRLAIIYSNETGQQTIPAYSSDVAITVYPREKLTQIVTNNVTMILSIILYFLSIIGTVGLSITLWDRKPSSQNKKDDTKSNDNTTNIINEHTNVFQINQNEKRGDNQEKNTEEKNS